MTNEESKREMERIIREATLAIHDKIPRAIAVLAKSHYRNNFRLGGFDGKPWKTHGGSSWAWGRRRDTSRSQARRSR